MIFSTFALLFSSLSFSTGFTDVTHTIPTIDVANYQFHYSISFNSFNEIDNNDRYTIISTLGDGDSQVQERNFLNLTYRDSTNELYIYCNSTNSNYFMRFTLTNQDDDFFLDSGFLYDFLTQDNMDYTFTIPTGTQFAYSLSLYYYYIDPIFYDSYIIAYGTTAQEDSYQDGYNYGYNAGYDSGYAEGQSVSSQISYDNGYNDGYRSGYQVGKNDGINISNYNFTSLFASISDTPILMFRRLFGFEIFGTSVMAIFMSLFTALIVIKVIKKVF